MNATEKFPFKIFLNPPTVLPVMWLQNPRDLMDGNQFWAPEEKRIYIRLKDEKIVFESLLDAALELMERELGGFPDRHDPLPFRWVITNSLEKGGGNIIGGNVHVPGKAFSGKNEGVSISFNIGMGFPQMGFSKIGVKLKPPIRVCIPFNWSVLDDEGFERLMFRLFFEMEDKYDNVEWLQKTRAADSGRDISAIRLENGNRLLIQARHQISSITAPDVNTLVVKAETWNPAFQEVVIVTSSTFTQEAVRWIDNHNTNPGNRPIVKAEPCGHLEVLLTKHPYLISHLGLRG